MNKKQLIRYLVLMFAVILAYGDTLTLDYASDDRMIIFENDYVLQGDAGKIMTKDAFTGYFGEGDQLVAGGRYRPLSQLTFMLEYQVFGGGIKDKVGLHRASQNEELFSNSALPVIQHGINMLYFLALCLLIFITLQRIFPQYDNDKWYLSLPFLATMIFLLHPLHTEAVANIKGRDEIMCMLGAVAALYCSLRYIENRRWWWLLLAFAAMLFGLFSKENAITFLAVIPLGLYFAPQEKRVSDYVWTLVPAVLASILFLVARTHALGGFMGTTDNALVLNNPFVNVGKGAEIATVLLTWGIYLKLMLFPHPLTHDYYPNQIEITSFGNPIVWLILLAIIGLIAYIIWKFRTKGVVVFAIAFFIITFSITSNLLFNVGTFMNERFVFMPLLGFALVLALLFKKLSEFLMNGGIFHPQAKGRRTPQVAQPQKAPTVAIVLMALVGVLYLGKTAARNLAWKNDVTLFTTDVRTSSESMKCTLSAGGSYLKLYEETKKTKYLKLAEEYLTRALALGRSDTDTWSLLGKMYFLKKDYVAAANCYRNVLTGKPDDPDALANLASMQGASVSEASRLLEEGKRDEALAMARAALQDNPESPQLLNILGRLAGEEASVQLAQAEQQLRDDPDNTALKNSVKQKRAALEQSIKYLEKAHQLDPDFASACENLGIAYASVGRFDEAIPLLERALELYTEEKDLDRTRNNLSIMQAARTNQR